MEGFIGGYYEDSWKVNFSVRVIDIELFFKLWVVSEELINIIDILEFL